MNVGAISNYIPNVRLSSPTTMISRLTTIAVPIIALAGISSITGARAITYVECIDQCNEHRDAGDLAKLLCYTLCLIFARG